MFRYCLSLARASASDLYYLTELQEMRDYFLLTLNSGYILDSDFVKLQTAILSWLVENGIDHHYHVEHLGVDLPEGDGEVRRTATFISVVLAHASDTDWLRYRFGVLPLPEDAKTPNDIRWNLINQKKHWLGA